MADSADKASSALNPDSKLERSSISQSDAITQILASSKTIAVVGLSAGPAKPSFYLSEYMQQHGFRILPVNPALESVLGEKSYARLQDVPGPVDIVDIFRRSVFVPEIVDSAIQIGARCVWMQESVIHAEAAERARRAGIFVMMNSCILKEHIRRARELPQRTKLL